MNGAVEHRDFVTAIDREHAVMLDGICSINGGPDVACCAVKMSLSGMTVLTDAPVSFVDAVTLQLPQIGIVEAVVAEVLDGGFELRFEPAPRSKLGTFVTWLNGTGASSDVASDGRQHERIVPIKRLATLKRHDLPPSMARIVNLSRSGAAFTCGKPLELAERVELGAFSGSVVRLIDGGAAIRFDQLIDEDHFGVLIDLETGRTEPLDDGLAATSPPE